MNDLISLEVRTGNEVLDRLDGWTQPVHGTFVG